MMRVFLTLLFLCVLGNNACTLLNKEKILPGKIAAFNYTKNKYLIYNNSDTPMLKIKIRHDKEVRHGSFNWLNKENIFLGLEFIYGIDRNNDRCDLVLFDLSGNVVDRIYESKSGEIAWSAYPSKDDEKIVFNTNILVNSEEYPLEGLSPVLSMVIMDREGKKVLRKIDSIGRSPSFQLKESPWIDGNRLIYSIPKENKIISVEPAITPMKEKSAGVYLYDLRTNEHMLIVPDGRFAIASPTSEQVAYIQNNEIKILVLNDTVKDNTMQQTIYKFGSKEKVTNIHWTPDGKFLYLAYYKFYFGDLFTTKEKLIEVETGKEIPFKEIGHGFRPYTWK